MQFSDNQLAISKKNKHSHFNSPISFQGIVRHCWLLVKVALYDKAYKALFTYLSSLGEIEGVTSALECKGCGFESHVSCLWICFACRTQKQWVHSALLYIRLRQKTDIILYYILSTMICLPTSKQVKRTFWKWARVL